MWDTAVAGMVTQASSKYKALEKFCKRNLEIIIKCHFDILRLILLKKQRSKAIGAFFVPRTGSPIGEIFVRQLHNIKC